MHPLSSKATPFELLRFELALYYNVVLVLMFLERSRYWIDFDKWEVFINDEGTRTFLSLEVTGGGLAEVRHADMLVFSCVLSYMGIL